MSRGVRLLVCAVVLAAVVPGGALADARGEPDLSVSVADGRLAPGEETRLTLTLSNAGELRAASTTNPALNERVTTARDVRVTVDDGGAPLEVRTGTQAVGSLPDGATLPVHVAVSVDEDADPGTYRVPVTVRYRHDESITEPNGTVETDAVERRFRVAVTVEERARLRVVNASTDVSPESTGTLTLRLRNVGEARARDAVLSVASLDPDLRFGESLETTRFVGNWPEGATRTVTLALDAGERAIGRAYPFRVQATYRDERNASVRTAPRTFGVTPRTDGRFAVTGARTDVAAGGSGTVTLTLRNRGDDVEDASVALRSLDGTLRLGGTGGEATRFVGDWPGGRTRTVRVEAAAASAPDGEFPLRVVTSYRDPGNGTATTRPQLVGVALRTGSQFAVVESESDVAVGGTGTVTLTLRNEGDAVARDAVVSLSAPGGALVVGPGANAGASPSAGVGAPATRFVERWRPGRTRTVTYAVSVPASASGGTAPLEVTTSYRDGSGIRATGGTQVVGVDPRTESRFAVVGTESDVTVGGTGTVTLTLRNRGETILRDASVALRSPNADLRVGGGAAATRFVGIWVPNATRTVAFDVTADPSSGPRNYALRAVVDYETVGGVAATTSPVSVGVTPRERLSFAVEGVSSRLYVDEEGAVAGAVVNEGPRTARDAVVVLETASRNVRLPEASYAVGDLAPGERVPFAFDVAVAPTAEAGPRPFAVSVRYEDADGDTRESEAIRLDRRVAPRRDLVALEPINATFGIDESGRLAVRITNVGNVTLREVNARLAAGPPFTSEAPTSYVPVLEPGESATLGFAITVSEDAVENTQAVAVNVTAETAEGVDVRTEPRLVAVTIAEPPGAAGDVTTLAVGAVLVAVLLGAGWWWLRQ